MKRLLRATDLGARLAWRWRNRNALPDVIARDRPRLLVDVSAIIRHDAQTGIQRVVRAVWSELQRRSGCDIQVLPVFATSKHGYCYAPADFLQRDGLSRPLVPVQVGPGDKFLALDLSAHLLPKYRRQLQSWRAHGATVHVIVYDLLPITRPAWFTPSAVKHFARWLDVLRNDADQAICISNHVAGELRNVLQACEGTRVEIGRLQLGADIEASLPSSGLGEELRDVLAHLRSRPAILMVGTVEPRKGYESALAAFEHLWRVRPIEAPDLVLVGRAGWKTADLQAKLRSHPEFGRRLHWFDRMSDEGLCLLYKACRGLLMASRGEGWGLPLVEAAMHNRYVLARDIPVFREHGLANVLYFSDDAPDALGKKLLHLAEVGKKPAPPATLPTWSDSVAGLLDTIGLVELKPAALEPQLRKAS